MNPPIRVLYVDDSRFDRELVRDALEKEHGGFRMVEAQSREEFEARLGEGGFDLVLSDFHILGFEGLEVIDAVRARDPRLPVMIVTGTGSEEAAVEAMKRGAEDYVLKTRQHVRRLPNTILSILEKRRLREERERAREALLASAREWQVTFDAIGDAVCVLDTDGRILQANRAMGELLGRMRAEIVGGDCLGLMGCRADGPEGCAALRVRQSHRRETEVLQTGGRWLSVAVDPVLDDQGRLIRTIHTVTDITQRRRAEERLRFLAEASSQLASSLDHTTILARVVRLAVPFLAEACVVWALEEKGALPVAVAHADPSREESLRASLPQEPIDLGGGHPVARAMRTGRAEHCPGDLSVARGGEAPGPGGLLLDGGKGLDFALVVPMATGGRLLGAISFGRTGSARGYGPADLAVAEDLARRVALALDNARLYRKSQEAIRLRDDFLALAAHELKTPVTSLKGFAQVAIRQLDKHAALPPDLVRRTMQVIDQQSDRLTRLVCQLLDVSRIEHRSLRLEWERVEVTRLVEEVLDLWRTRSDRAVLLASPPMPVWARVDPLRLEQVLVNLIDNAVKFSPTDTRVDVEVSMSAPGTVRLAVRDRGIGIAPQHRPRVFDRFHQIPTAMTAGGMGLGLYVSQHIVELHGGRIDIEAPLDGGTRFVVTLPDNLGPDLAAGYGQVGACQSTNEGR